MGEQLLHNHGVLIIIYFIPFGQDGDKQRYMLTDGSIDDDSAYADIPEECWLESPKEYR